MKSPSEWNEEFRHRIAMATSTGISYDMNKIITDLAEDIQNDALGLQLVYRPRFGIITRAEAESMSLQQVTVAGSFAGTEQGKVSEITIDGEKVPNEPS